MNDYSVKELVTEIVIPKLDQIQSDLVEKAERDRVHQLAAEVSAFHMLVNAELAKKADRDQVERLESWRNRLAGGIVVVAFVATVNGFRLWLG